MSDIRFVDKNTLNTLDSDTKLAVINRVASQLIFIPLLSRATTLGLDKSIAKHNIAWPPIGALRDLSQYIKAETLDDTYAKIYRDVVYKIFDELGYTRNEFTVRRSYSTISIYIKDPIILWLSSFRAPYNNHAKAAKWTATTPAEINTLVGQIRGGLAGPNGRNSYRTYATNGGAFAISFPMLFSNMGYHTQQFTQVAISPLTIADQLKAVIKPARDVYSKLEADYKIWFDKRTEAAAKQTLPLAYDNGSVNLFYWIPKEFLAKYGPIPYVATSWDVYAL